MKLPRHSTARPLISIGPVKSHKERHTRPHGRGKKTTKISSHRYSIDGIGTIIFPDEVLERFGFYYTLTRTFEPMTASLLVAKINRLRS